MAKFGPWLDGYIRVNGVDLSDHCSEITLNIGNESLPNHAMGDVSNYSRAGLRNASLSATFFQDFASSSVEDTLRPLAISGSTFTVVVRPTSDAVGSTNPAYSGSWFISGRTPLGGTHGDNLMDPVTFELASDITVVTS